MEPQGLVDNHVKIGKVLDRLVIQSGLVRGLVGRVNLFLKTALDLRIQGKFVTLIAGRKWLFIALIYYFFTIIVQKLLEASVKEIVQLGVALFHILL